MTGPTGPLTGLITGFYVSRETTTNKAKDARIPTAADRGGCGSGYASSWARYMGWSAPTLCQARTCSPRSVRTRTATA
jgi:hypothetical protein